MTINQAVARLEHATTTEHGRVVHVADPAECPACVIGKYVEAHPPVRG